MKVSLFTSKQTGNRFVTKYPHIIDWNDYSLFSKYDVIFNAYEDFERKQDNWLFSNLGYADIDEGSISIEQFIKEIKALYYIVPSKSHRIWKGEKAPCDRFHIIFQLSKIYQNEYEYYKVLNGIYNFLLDKGLNPDTTSLDTGRFYFGTPHTPMLNDGAFIDTIINNEQMNRNIIKENVKNSSTGASSGIKQIRKIKGVSLCTIPCIELEDYFVKGYFPDGITTYFPRMLGYLKGEYNLTNEEIKEHLLKVLPIERFNKIKGYLK
jgi:hypothetical protein